jgi:hypothetical protein
LAIVYTVLDAFSRRHVKEIVIDTSHAFIPGWVEGLTVVSSVPYTRALVESTIWETGETLVGVFGVLQAVEFETRTAYDAVMVEHLVTCQAMGFVFTQRITIRNRLINAVSIG